jgi:hypothetical protein
MTTTQIEPTKNENFWKFVKPLVFKTIIGSVIAAALVAVLAIFVGDFNTLSLQLILTIIVVIAFTLLAWYDADVSSKRSHNFALVGVGVSVYLLIMGFIKIWIIDTPAYVNSYYNSTGDDIVLNFIQWIGLVAIARIALLHAHLLLNIHRKYATPLLQVIAKVTLGLITLLALLLSIPIIFDNLDYSEGYWRAVSAIAILDLLGTILIPLSHALFMPKNNDSQQTTAQRVYYNPQANIIPQETTAISRPETNYQTVPSSIRPQPGSVVFDAPIKRDRRLEWPRYVDGTPLPAKADGSPNFDEVERYPR